MRWQIWTALLVYLLLRHLSFLSDWSHSFSRLFTLIRTSRWKKWALLDLLDRYGTARQHHPQILIVVPVSASKTLNVVLCKTLPFPRKHDRFAPDSLRYGMPVKFF
ncbi:MAG: hypothetical protein KGJ60_10045 [Verrucomicrobiota bacterium]|nr:hypothetical protein [Verrucomicrobiota bacterium]